MIHPSYDELIDAINANKEEDDNTMTINSRYSVVLASSKRARQIIAGADPLIKDHKNRKPLSVAIDELYQGEVKILESDTEEETEAQLIDIQEETEE